MSYLSLLIAWFLMRDSNLTGPAWWDAYLDQLVAVETWFYHASWWVLGVMVIVAIVLMVVGVLKRGRGEAFAGGVCLGCAAIFLLLWPLWEWLTLVLATGMADAVGPAGIVNQGKLVTSLILYLIFGVG